MTDHLSHDTRAGQDDTTSSPAPSGPACSTSDAWWNRQVVSLLDLPYDAVTMDGALAAIRQAVARRERLFLSTPNVNFAMAARKDKAFRASVLHSDLVVADGMPLIWLARLQGLPLTERVAGADLFERLLTDDSGPPVRVYFFGGPAGAAQAAAERVNQRAGRMHCVGWCSPGFVSVDDLSTPTYLDPINRSQADFVVVALGAAKGQAWIMRNQALLDAPVLSHLGAVVNFTAGSIHRAPHWMQRTGLEWCWRIAQEPALWRRYWRDGWALAGALVRGSLAWLEARWRNPRRNTSCGSPSVLVRDSTGWQYTSGAIPGEPDNLAMLRAALKNAATDGCGLTVHLSNTRHTSAAELALLQLAQARLHGLTITVATRSQCKRMTASGLNVCTRNATN